MSQPSKKRRVSDEGPGLRAIFAAHRNSAILDVPKAFAAPRLFCFVAWDTTGHIVAALPLSARAALLRELGPEPHPEALATRLGAASELSLKVAEIEMLAAFSMVVPGFVDTHVHASQYPYTGTGISRPLMAPDGFLHKFAFPTEKSFADPEVARRVYPRVVSKLLSYGTTTAVYYATLHSEASVILAEACLAQGQRCLVGKVLLDQMSLDEEYVMAKGDSSLAEVESFLNSPIFQGDAGVQPRPVLTPRFIPSCSKAFLEGLGRISQRHPQVLVQTHVTESRDEVAFARSVWEQQTGAPGSYESDLQVLRECGLLQTGNLLAAHCVHMDEAEQRLARSHGVRIAHCPLSNAYFAEGGMPLAKMLRDNEGGDASKFRIGLGTDVAGGYSPSLLENMRRCVETDKMRKAQANEPPCAQDITIFTALHLATLGGAECINEGGRLGLFGVGFAMDAVLLSGGGLDLDLLGDTVNEEEDLFVLAERLLHLSEREHIQQVWVQGACVS